MLNLLGIRRRERSDSDSSTTRRVPVVDDIYLKPSVPVYIRNNTGWENMPAPPYDSSTGATTGPTPPAGAPYPLSNIPAQIYYLQPQQSIPAMPSGGGSKENKPAFMGQPAMSTPPLSSQPQFVPSYYTYPPPSVYQWPQGSAPNPMMPMAVPVQGYPPPSSSVAASQSHQSQTSPRTSSPIQSMNPEMHEKRKTNHRVPVLHTVDSITPAMEEAIRALPKAYALPKVDSNVTTNEPLHGHNRVVEEKPKAAPVLNFKSKESTRFPLRQLHKTVSISSMKKTRGYQPPTVESVVDSDDEEPATHFRPRSTTCVWDSSSDEDLPPAAKTDSKKNSSPIRSRSEDSEAHNEGPSNSISPAKHHVRFETEPGSEHGMQEQAAVPTPFDNKTKFVASFPPPMSPVITSPLLKKSVRRCASDHVNFEQYRKRHGMAKENQPPMPMPVPGFMTGAARCCDHLHSGVGHDGFYSQTMPSIPSTPLKRNTRDAHSSPLKPVAHDMCGYSPYTPMMPMPDSAYVPRTFSVHTVSPSLASEQLYQPETGQNEPPSPKSPISFKCPSVSASPGSVGQQGCCPSCDEGQSAAATNDNPHSGHTERAMSDVTEEVPSPQFCRTENTSPPMSYDENENMDPVTQLGEGMPPYDFDLFSEGQHLFADGWPQPSPGDEGHEREVETADDIFEDENPKDTFGGGYGDSFYSNTVVDEHANTPKVHRHSFEDDPIIPDYDFDLFSDVTNRRPSSGGDYDKTCETSYSKDNWSKLGSQHQHGTEKENVPNRGPQMTLAVRSKARLARKPSTLVVEEYNGTDDDATSVASSNFGKRGIRSLVSRTQRFVDCEVISNPDEPDGARAQPPVRCR
ncbi:hypothetical protein Sste5346_001655 [Sporothrix stenoceras]|uniref:Uncharacterized protein n=1 Tax=Sporothrix stenoceras TaxID=5173 RepID=A0ABR3ZP50_9PEZI